MKKYLSIFTTCIVSLFTLTACGPSQIPEEVGGKVNNSYKAPTEISSRNIESFKTSFYITDRINQGNDGRYSFTVERDADGNMVLSEDCKYNISVIAGSDVCAKLQAIIEANNLVSMNGIDVHTSGLPEEFAPCEMSVTYDSGEKLYFSEDNYPEAEWALQIAEFLRGELIAAGHEELLPPEEDRTLVGFAMTFYDGNCKSMYMPYFTNEDNGNSSGHYMIAKKYIDGSKAEVYKDLVVPDDFYENLYVKITEINLAGYSNGKIEPGNTSELTEYAFFSMEMESGLQINAFIEGEDSKELCELLKVIAEYEDSILIK